MLLPGGGNASHASNDLNHRPAAYSVLASVLYVAEGLTTRRRFPRKHFHAQLRRLVEAGFGKRILFGSDQMIWPDTIRLAIETIEAADFLSQEQKRDIFCRNAARFLRLDVSRCDE